MKKANSLLLLLSTFSLFSSPTGRITSDSPPFFSDEFYKPTAENMDDLYQQVVISPTPAPLYDYLITTTDSQGKEQP